MATEYPNPIPSPYPRPSLNGKDARPSVQSRLVWDLKLILCGAVTGAVEFASKYDLLTGPAVFLSALGFVVGVVMMIICQRRGYGLLWQMVTMFGGGALLAWTFFAGTIFRRQPIDPDSRLLSLYLGLGVLYALAGGIGRLLKIKPIGAPDWYESIRYSLSVAFVGPLIALVPGLLLSSLLFLIDPGLTSLAIVIVPACFAAHGYLCFSLRPDRLSARAYVAATIVVILVFLLAGIGYAMPSPFVWVTLAGLALYGLVMEVLIRRLQEPQTGEVYD